MNTEIVRKASEMINSRRLAALSENDRRYNEIEIKIPEIAEINRILASTSINLFKIMQEGKDVQQKLRSIELQNKQAQEMVASLLVQNGYPHDYLDLHYTCENCSDTGFHDGKRCSCFTELIGQLSVNKLNENAHIRLYSFDTFDLSYYKNISTDEDNDCFLTMSRNFEYCKNYAKTFSKNSKNLLIYGKTGIGKTHLSLSIAKYLLENGVNVLYDSALNFLMRIENEHFGRSDSDIDTFDTIINADLVIMDDLGTEYETGFYSSTIYNIVNTRLSKGLPTIISTNLSPTDISKRYEARIVSRLVTMYVNLKFTGDDVRAIKSENEVNDYFAAEN